MPVPLTTKYVPDHVVRRLREQAGRNDRSLRGELLVFVEEAVRIDQSIGVDVARADR